MIGCSCEVCTSKDPRDKRRRCGIYVENGSSSIIVDTPPEMRLSCVEFSISRADAVLLTHAHMDHIAGFDDVRRFNTINGGQPINCYAAAETINDMHHIFPYIKDTPNELGLYRPMIKFVPVTEPFNACSMRITPLPVEHGPRTNGYRFDDGTKSFAYVPDCSAIPDDTAKKMQGLDLLIIDCLREKFHPTHLTVSKMMEYAAALKPANVLCVHMCHSISCAHLDEMTPDNIHPAYDGLTVEV